MHTNYTTRRVFRLRLAPCSNIVAPNWAQAFRVPLSRQCAVNPRDKANSVAPAVRPKIAVFVAILSASETASCGCAPPFGSVRDLGAFCADIPRRSSCAENPPLSVRQQAHSAPRAPALDCQHALAERRKRCPRRPTSELCFRVRLAGGWPAGRTAFASFRSNFVSPIVVAATTESRDLRLSNLPITRAVICRTRSALRARVRILFGQRYSQPLTEFVRNPRSQRDQHLIDHCASCPA